MFIQSNTGGMNGEDIFNDPKIEEQTTELLEQYDNNKEIDSGILENLVNELLSDPLTKEMLQAGIKRRWIEQHLIEGISSEQQQILLKSILNFSSVYYEEEIEGYMEKEEVSEIYDKVKENFEENTVSDELRQRYNQNLVPIEEEVNERISTLKRRIMGNKYDEIQEIKSNDVDNEDKIIQKIEDSYKNEKHKPMWKKIDQLENELSRISQFPYTEPETTYDWGATAGDATRHIKHFSIRIYDPRVYTGLYHFEPEYEEYPLQWLDLPLGRDRLLFRFYKDGKDVEQVITNEVNSEGYFDNLVNTLTKIPSYRNREELLKEIPTAFSCGLYGSVINLTLPQIEYLMWQYAAYIDSKGDSNIINIEYNTIWNFDYREHENLKIINSNGSVNKSPTVGALVEDTDLSTHLTPRLVRYFGDELFSDRNPILHGNSSDYYSELEAAKKIVFLNRVAEQLVDTITEMYADEISEEGILDDEDIPVELYTANTDSKEPNENE